MPPDPAPHAAKPRAASRPGAAAVIALVALPVAAPAAAPTFSVDYVVSIRRGDPGHARVRWLLAGIDEIESFRLVFRDGRTSRVTGTGTLAWHDRTLLWTPGGPYAHLAYTVTIAVAPGSALDPRRLLRLYARTVPLLESVLGPPPPRLLVVSAPDPMWHGGLSGEDSFFVNGRIPLRSPDKTSTYLHELFHVWQPFRPKADGRWISEGLAEYYSLALQHRAGRLSDRSFARGIRLFARYGRWGADLSRTRHPAVLNNSAPLVMWWIDQEIRRLTGGRHTLDDAVRALVNEHARLSTASFLRAVNRTADRDFTPLFRRHVYRGERPPVATIGAGN